VLADWVLPPIAGAGVLCGIGALGLLAHDAWLTPSLGSAILIQVMTPREPSARLWNTFIGQALAVFAGFAAVYIAGDHTLPAVAIALAATVLLQRALQATCPAGGAVALLIALGSVPANLHGAWLLAIGIVLVTGMGEAMRVVILKVKARRDEG
jgi:CBS-domain-containing membrane protein